MGKLDLVYNKEAYRDNHGELVGGCSIGTYNGRDVVIINGDQHTNRWCVTHFGEQSHDEPAQTYFITAGVRNSFTPLEQDEYILLGHWTASMQKKKFYPRLWELEQYFEPGDLDSVAYFKHQNIGRRISTRRPKEINNVHTFMQGNFRNASGTRLIVVEKRSLLGVISGLVRAAYMTPVQMLPKQQI